MIAAAVGFAVSTAQYLPTIFAGSGRFATLTTEALSLASGGNRRIVGLFAFVLAIGVLVFSGLTAYDTQKIKEMYFEGDDVLVVGRKAIMGALTLYLDFINLFTFLLHFLGNRE